jgi:C-terminal processing protease CtpA/Prc
VLHATAHRAFDSQAEGNTADLAESHFRAYGTAIQELDLLISDIVVSELDGVGEDCQCQCPACGIGLCLCASHGANTVRQVWRETIPTAPEGGLRVRRPRAGSEAQRAGLLDGDRVLAIDGNEIGTDLDISAVQTAIRAHSAGDRMRLRVLRDGSGPIELILRRA